MALDVYIKTKPCDPPVVDGITFAYDAVSKLWKGNGADATVLHMTGAGMPFFTGTEVTRFKYDADNVTAKASALATAKTNSDAAALALSTDIANGTKITAMQTASAAVATAADALAAAVAASQVAVAGKTNPYV